MRAVLPVPENNVLHPEFGPDEFAAAANVSRETLTRVKAYVALLVDSNARHNLVSAKSLDDVWRRHIWDSAQLQRFIPESARSLADLGSGAGFPGLVLAVLLRERGNFQVSLYESTGKKSKFLEAAVQLMDLNAKIFNTRMESAKPQGFDVVTARACAPLEKLLAYAQIFQTRNTVNLFLKGQSVEVELTQARKSWRMTLERHESQTDSSGVILEIRDIAHVARR